MLGIALGLASSVAWGVSDFLGGLQSRRISALSVLLVSQPVGLLLALMVALAFGGDRLGTRDTAIAVGAGAAVVIALGAFYRAMALGSVSVVAAVVGVVLVAREDDPEWRAAGRAAVGLAALAALGFGTFFLALDETSGREPTWTIVALRCGGGGAPLIAAAVMRPPVRVGRAPVPS